MGSQINNQGNGMNKEQIEAQRVLFVTWVTTVWRPDDGAALLAKEWPRMEFAAWLASATASEGRIAELTEANNALMIALHKVADWRLPGSNRTWDDGTPMSYGAAFGSNGERDYMQAVAMEAIELAALAGSATPSTNSSTAADAGSLDQAMTKRDEYHDWADKLAGAIAEYFRVDIGEHSSVNCPWSEALDAIGNASSPAEPFAWCKHNGQFWAFQRDAANMRDGFKTNGWVPLVRPTAVTAAAPAPPDTLKNADSEDAARYRWLTYAGWIDDAIMERHGIQEGISETLDSAIDSAMRGGN